MTETIYINSNGDLLGLNGYILDNLSIGPKKVSRVSEIEFNHSLQLWEAVDGDGNIIGRDTSRQTLVEKEKDYLNNKIEKLYEENKDGFFKKNK